MKRFLVTFLFNRLFVPLVVMIAVFGAVEFFYASPHLPTSLWHFVTSIAIGLFYFGMPFMIVLQWKHQWSKIGAEA